MTAVDNRCSGKRSTPAVEECYGIVLGGVLLCTAKKIATYDDKIDVSETGGHRRRCISYHRDSEGVARSSLRYRV